MTNRKPDSVIGEPQALKVSARCPSCGAESVVVFPMYVLNNDKAEKDVRLVCTVCGPSLEPKKN